jgi:putative PIN family toxin of toxin-antitoxin system
MRALVDTNVFVAALLRSASCRAILEALRDRSFTLITSEPLLRELSSVLGRPKFAGSISAADRRELLDLVRREGRIVPPRRPSIDIRDPNDRPVLDCAYAADALVTGDRDLLVLGAVGKTAVLPPATFLARLARP